MCVLSGCDYLDSPRGLGIKKAYYRIRDNHSIEQVLKNEVKFSFPPDYYVKFLKAYLTFKFMPVFCPVKRKMVSLNENITSYDSKALNYLKALNISLDFMGTFKSQTIARKIADLSINPITNKSFISHFSFFFNKKEKGKKTKMTDISNLPRLPFKL